MYEVLRSYRQIESALMVPTQPWWLAGAAVDMDFSNGRYYGGTLSELMSTSRASSGYVTNGDGTLTLFGNDTPRIGIGTGLLVEEARTNVWSPSAEVTANMSLNAGGTRTDVVDATAPASPATVMDWSGGTASGQRNYATGLGAVVVTISVFFRIMSGASTISFTINDQFNNAQTVFTPNTLSFVDSNGGVGRLLSGPDPNGWYRISMTSTATVTGTALFLGMVGGAARITGIQVEAGPFASSHIVTTGPGVTRAGDNITLTGSASSSVNLSVASAFSQAGPTPNQIQFPRVLGGGNILFYVPSGQPLVSTMSNNINADLGISAAGAYDVASQKAAASWSGAGRSISKGALLATDAFVQQAGPFTYNIGCHTSLGNNWDGYIQRLAFWNSRLPDATLQALTGP